MPLASARRRPEKLLVGQASNLPAAPLDFREENKARLGNNSAIGDAAGLALSGLGSPAWTRWWSRSPTNTKGTPARWRPGFQHREPHRSRRLASCAARAPQMTPTTRQLARLSLWPPESPPPRLGGEPALRDGRFPSPPPFDRITWWLDFPSSISETSKVQSFCVGGV